MHRKQHNNPSATLRHLVLEFTISLMKEICNLTHSQTRNALDPQKTKDIEAWPAPHSKMVVKSFPGAEKKDHGGDGTGYDHPPDQVICGPW